MNKLINCCKAKKMFSLRKQIRITILVLTCIMLLFFSIQLSLSIYGYQMKVDEHHTTALEKYAAELQNGMEQLYDTVGSIYSSNSSFQELGGDQSPADQWNDAYNIKVLLTQQGKANKYLGGLYLYYDSFRKNLYYVQRNVAKKDQTSLSNAMSSINSTTMANAYQETPTYVDSVITTESSGWYFIVMQKSKEAIGGFIDLSAGLSSENESTYGVIYNDSFYRIKGKNLSFQSDQIGKLKPGRNKMGNNIIYYQNLPSQGMAVVEVLDNNLGLYIDEARIIGAILVLLLIPLMIIIYHFVNKQLVIPLNDMTNAMQKIQEGIWEVEFQESNKIIEIENVRMAIKVMLGEIEQFKIKIYEEQLLKQQVELQYFCQKLTPHFYTNCLKNAYYMLELGEEDNVKNFLLCMSKHLRYLLQNDFSQIKVCDEIEFVKNYIEMEKYRAMNSIVAEVVVDPELDTMIIPLLTIQSFVENSMKYARESEKKELRISISVSRLKTDGEDFLDIQVQDNGPGYPDQLLNRLNHPELAEIQKQTGGVANLLSRLHLYYGAKVSWYFRNENGAVSEIFVQMNQQMNVKDEGNTI